MMNRNIIERMYLKEIPSYINRKDIRSARKWCKKNGVTIYPDGFGDFVIRSDFELAYDLPLIRKLRADHGENWKIIYKAYQEDRLFTMLDLDKKNTKENTRYIPKGNIAKRTND
jgi:hypothetical protein